MMGISVARCKAQVLLLGLKVSVTGLFSILRNSVFLLASQPTLAQCS
jgi:hypothetical protein